MAVSDYWIAAGVLATLQAGAPTFRIEREREMDNHGEQVWFPVADWLNLVGLTSLVLGVFVLPVLGMTEEWTGRLVGVDGILVAAYPLASAGHYEILRPRKGRKSRPYCPCQELLIVPATLAAMLIYVGAILVMGP
jgi:hypothetical protein